MFAAMQASITTFAQTIPQTGPGARPAVAFSTHMGSANSSLGTRLLDSGHMTGVNLELDGFKAIGNAAISLSIDYPTLDSTFDPFGGHSAEYLNFYKAVVAGARARGLKVIIETGPLFSDPILSNVAVLPFYQTLSLESYKAGRAAHAVLIAQQLAPDYLSVIQEPDTEASQTGKSELARPEVSLALLNQILTAYRAAGLHIPIGAGVGSWMSNWDAFIGPFSTTSVDFIDLHVYPANRDFLARAQGIVDRAHAAGKKVGMSEAWLNKMSDSELGTLKPAQVFARDNYGFWMPLDSIFLKAMIEFSFHEHFEFLAGFQGGCFRGYVDYTPSTSGLGYRELGDAALAVRTATMLAGTFTGLARDWSGYILPSPDKVAPAPVGSITPTAYANSILLNWPAGTDNVGVGGYRVVRNGTPLGTTALTTWYDTALPDGASYTYAVSSYDAAGNAPSPTQVTVQTKDVTPPTKPGNFSVTLAAATITVRWTASTDNVKIANYRVYRGLDGLLPTAIANVAANSTTYSNASAPSSTRSCYNVVAVDTAGKTSPATATLCVTTPDTTPPTVPLGVAARAVSATQVVVTWKASTDKIGVTGYKVYRVAKGGALNLISGAVTGTSFTDRSTTSHTTYTYRTAACDAAGNCSQQSAGALLTTP
jgi:fibronectin type 3 domain-containing protein